MRVKDCECQEDEVCESCCPHDDTDEYECLDCGADLTEDRMAQAYDRAKGREQDRGVA